MATRLTKDEPVADLTAEHEEIPSAGSASFIELDAEKMGDHWSVQPNFNCVWISEALSHLPDKLLFFQNAFKVLGSDGKLIIADWFKAEDLSNAQVDVDITPIEGIHPLVVHLCFKLTTRRWNAPAAPLHTTRLRSPCTRSRLQGFLRASRHQPECSQDLVSLLLQISIQNCQAQHMVGTYHGP